ncbi:hypothetical protein OY671_011608 [Metschnikowia pulcherrima]|nr:hypothetical protein OY671_011608 [Metschnikowia pulcherrima]
MNVSTKLSKRTSGAAMAAAAAVLFSMAPFASAFADESKVECHGVNACKGQSACKSAHNACAGQNGCKGQGFSELTKKECDAAKAKQK